MIHASFCGDAKCDLHIMLLVKPKFPKSTPDIAANHDTYSKPNKDSICTQINHLPHANCADQTPQYVKTQPQVKTADHNFPCNDWIHAPFEEAELTGGFFVLRLTTSDN